MTWMVYGANGYTGQLVAQLAHRRGERPILAGRSASKIAEVAASLGLPHRAFDLADPVAVRDALADVDVVAHCAGPFSATSSSMVAGCLSSRTHYVDVTGEIAVFERVFARHEDAVSAGVVLLPGAGFDVVPTDCLAATLAAALPTATQLDLAFIAGGGISPGTLKTSVEGMATGGRVRIDGQLREDPVGSRHRIVRFPSGEREVHSVPWGDLVTAYRSTGIPTITTYTRMPGVNGFAGRVQALFSPILRLHATQRLGKALARRFASGPGEQLRANSGVEVWCEVRDEAGHAVSATITGPNGYSLTADSTVRAVLRLLAGGVEPGAHTPSTAFGADFVRELDDVTVTDPEVREPVA